MRQRFIRFVIALCLLLLPIPAAAAGQIVARDSVAGLGIPVSLAGFEPLAHITLRVESPDGTRFDLPVTIAEDGNKDLVIPGARTAMAGNYRVALFQNTRRVASDAYADVFPDSVDPRASRVAADTTIVQSNGTDAATITVTLSDHLGNLLADKEVDLISSRPEDQIRSIERSTDAGGQQRFTLTTRVPGPVTLVAMDLLSQTVLGRLDLTVEDARGSGGPAPRQSFTGNNGGGRRSDSHYAADVIDQANAQAFEVTVSPSDDVKQGDVLSMKIRAIDRSGNTVENYVSNDVRITAPDDPDARLPGDLSGNGVGIISISAKALGVKNLPLSIGFETSGEQIVHVEDRTDPRRVISGEAVVTVRSTGDVPASRRIQIAYPEENGVVNTASIRVRGKGPAYATLEVTVTGGTDTTGDTDDQGNFEIPVELDPTQKAFTFKITDDSGKYRSPNVHVRLDTSKPTIERITFSPEKPEQGSSVLAAVSVKSASRVSEVTVTIGGTATTLTENPKSPGSFQGLFTAPAAGSYQPDVVAVTEAGNRGEVKGMLVVAKPGLAVVKNVKAAAAVNSMELSWDAVADATKYRIYVGDDPGNFLYNLDTDKAVTTATVAGLKPGTLYYLAVTALADDRESGEKSAVISGRPLGIQFVVKPGPESLALQWTVSPDLQKRLSSFVVAYGVDPDRKTEKRLVNSQAVVYTLHDLLPDVMYDVEVTPIALTGEVLSDLAAKAQGTPFSNGTGFHASPSEPAPLFPVADTLPAAHLTHPGAPSTPESGIPSQILWIAFGLGACGVVFAVQQRRKQREMMVFFQMMQHQYRH